MIPPEARARLAEQMEQRRLELRLTWREVSEAGGISYEVIRNLRNGRGAGIAALTKRGIDRGLQWLEGCGVDNILAGRPPLPAALGPVPPVIENFVREMGVEPADPAVVAIRQEINRAELAHGENPTGAQVFGTGPVGVVESVIWDDPRATRESKILAIAGLRADRARFESGEGSRIGRIGLAPVITSGGT